MFSFFRTAKPTELFPGVEKPTVTLVHMLVAEMLQNIDAHCKRSGERRKYHHMSWEAEFPSFSMRITESYTENRKCNVVGLGMAVVLFRLKVDATFYPDEKEKSILLAGFQKFLALNERSSEIKKETDRQQRAIDVIENLFKPKAPVEPPSPTLNDLLLPVSFKDNL